MKLGIVGQGFVGTAIREVMANYYEGNTFDIKQDCTCDWACGCACDCACGCANGF